MTPTPRGTRATRAASDTLAGQNVMALVAAGAAWRGGTGSPHRATFEAQLGQRLALLVVQALERRAQASKALVRGELRVRPRALGGGGLHEARVVRVGLGTAPAAAVHAGVGAATASAPSVSAELARTIPRPPHAYMTQAEPGFDWLAPGVRQVPLELSAGDRLVRPLRFREGYTIPDHGHSGLEWLLVLGGELSDDSDGRCDRRGDVCRSEPGKVHVQRVSASEPCIALVANLGPLLPQSWFGRLLARVVDV